MNSPAWRPVDKLKHVATARRDIAHDGDQMLHAEERALALVP